MKRHLQEGNNEPPMRELRPIEYFHVVGRKPIDKSQGIGQPTVQHLERGHSLHVGLDESPNRPRPAECEQADKSERREYVCAGEMEAESFQARGNSHWSLSAVNGR